MEEVHCFTSFERSPFILRSPSIFHMFIKGSPRNSSFKISVDKQYSPCQGATHFPSTEFFFIIILGNICWIRNLKQHSLKLQNLIFWHCPFVLGKIEHNRPRSGSATLLDIPYMFLPKSGTVQYGNYLNRKKHLVCFCVSY